MFRFSKYVPLAAVLLGLSYLGLNTQSAQAGMLPTLTAVPPASDGMGHFIYDYSVEIPKNFQVKVGDSFTIYDFQGYVSGSASVPNADWTVSSVANVTPPKGLSPSDVVDDPSIPNITWTYTGAGGGTGVSGEAFLTFTANSSNATVWNPPDSVNNVASAIHNAAGGHAYEITNTEVPTAGNTPRAPEPTTLAMFGIGMPLLGAFNWLRRRKS